MLLLALNFFEFEASGLCRFVLLCPSSLFSGIAMYVLQQAGLLRQDLVFTFIFWRFGFTSIPCIDGCFVVVVLARTRLLP